MFFVGQLGKYVPGSVWSIGAHAHLAARHGVPLRVTVGTSLMFLGLNLATAGLVVGVARRSPARGTPGCRLAGASARRWSRALVGLLPPVVNRLGRLSRPARRRLRLGAAPWRRWSC